MTTDEQTVRVQQLFIRHQSAIKAFVLSLVPQFSEAEDILQETFLTVTQKSLCFQEGTNFLAWACAIARLKVLEAQRHCASCTFSPQVIESLTSSVTLELFADCRQQALTHCLQLLPPRSRELIECRYHRGLLPGEIARSVARSVNYVHVALAKARAMLRQCVERHLRRQEPA